MLELSKQLVRNGLQVCVITSSKSDFTGFRVLFDNIRTYYLPKRTFEPGFTFPAIWFSAPEIFKILKKEKITHVHCHQTTSAITYDTMLVAHLMGLKVFLTEHSLFSLAVVGAIHLNSACNPLVCGCDGVIAVSNIQKENLKARFHQINNIVVIPNGIDPKKFKPTKEKTYFPTVIAVTRFEKRRGGEILPQIIKIVCESREDVHWIIAGGGSKLEEAREFIKDSSFENRVKLLGAVSHDEIPKIMNKGQFFLNCSMTDAFCMSIVEAAACGLFVVSTNVGGIPEVLPQQARKLCAPCVRQLSTSLLDAIDKNMKMESVHEIISKRYSWEILVNQIISLYKATNRKQNIWKTCALTGGLQHSLISIVLFSFTYIIILVLKLIS